MILVVFQPCAGPLLRALLGHVRLRTGAHAERLEQHPL